MNTSISNTKRKREEIILDAAFSVFLELGINGATMEEIALKAKTTRQTMYRYFPTRDELILAVELRVLSAIFTRLGSLFSTAKGISGDNLLQVIDVIVPQFIDEYADELLYTSLFDTYYRNYPDQTFYQRMKAVLKGYHNPFTRIIRDTADMSRLESMGYPVELLGETLSNSLLSLCQRVLTRRDILQGEYGFDPLIMVTIQMKLMVTTLLQPV